MRDGGQNDGNSDYDAVIVGASLAGCATAIALGRAGARVALTEKRPDPAAFKRTCSHFIQASAVPALERLDLLEPMLAAGALRTPMRAWTRWGWIQAPAERAREGVNLRREVLDPQWAAAFPTDSGLTFYAAMPTKDRLPEFRRDPEAALVSFLAEIPEAPPIEVSKRVGPVLGKIEMPNRVSQPVAPGLALVGDAAMAVDPLFGVGCGWALQSAEWLSESVAPALVGGEPLDAGLARYRRRHRRQLRGHAAMINEYATGRRQNRGERILFAGAARSPSVATTFDAFGTRCIGPGRALASMMPRALVVNARHALGRRKSGAAADAPLHPAAR